MKFYRLLLFAGTLLLTFPGYAARQNENRVQPAPTGENAGQPLDADTFYYFLESAERGNSAAQFRIGMIYLQGNGVAQDYSEAAKWFREAAEQGNTSAQSMLGAIYATGLGVTKDHTRSYMWLSLSIDGSKDKQAPFIQKATELSNAIVKEMTPQQIGEARELAEKWKAVYMKTPLEVDEKVLKSRLIKHVGPTYPEMARRMGIQGVVILKVIIDEEGNVEEIQPVDGFQMLVDAAIEAVRQWKYTPALMEGKAIKVKATVTVRFVMMRQ